MKNYSLFSSYKVIGERSITELSASLVELYHIRSGATLYILERDDDNMTFSIGFKTVPHNSTGVFHILEHSVLCGSEKFPIRDPFSELIKGSVSTFLNAMTYPEKTLYPVASKNKKAFLGLCDVYLDAVLHPLALKNKFIFMQEGHRLDIDGDGNAFENGVVYNEMKAAYGSPDELAYNLTSSLLFPNSTYSHDSGGDPNEIPCLTFEDFKRAHEEFYHPENSIIFLDGNIDEGEILPLIDSYLSEFDKTGEIHKLSLGTDVIEEVTRHGYAVTEGEDDGERLYIAYRAFPYTSRYENLALSVVTEILAETNDSPLTKRILSYGLCDSFSLYASSGSAVTSVKAKFVGVKEGRTEELIEIYKKELDHIISCGLDKGALRSSLARLEFNTREADYGRYPRGVLYGGTVIEAAHFGLDPAESLMYEDAFAFLRKKIDTPYYLDLFKQVIDGPSATLILYPDPDMQRVLADTSREAARQKYEGLSEKEKAALRDELRLFAKWQEEPDSDAALATLPTLSLEDLGNKLREVPTVRKEKDGITYIHHPIKTGGISYAEVLFDASDADREEVLYIKLYVELMREWATVNGSAIDFRNRAKLHTGSLFTTVNTIKCADDVKLYISVMLSVLEESEELAAELMREHIYDRLITDRELLTKTVKQIYISSKEAIISRGENYAITRSAARYSRFDMLKELIGGYSFHEFIKDLSEVVEDSGEEILSRLRSIKEKYFVKERLTVSTTNENAESFGELLASSIPRGGEAAKKCTLTPLPGINEAIVVPSQVSSSALASNLTLLGEDLYTGAFKTLGNILSNEILWNEIRVKGGAYDTGFSVRANSGSVITYSYADPTPARSIEAFSRLPEMLESFLSCEPELLRYIIGTVGSEDGITTPRTDGILATTYALSGITHKRLEEIREESIAVTKKELLRLSGILRDVLSHGTYTVVGPREAIGAVDSVLEI